MRGVTLCFVFFMVLILFQSTLPMRGVTPRCRRKTLTVWISIHTPHAGSDRVDADVWIYNSISIHTPHAGSDPRYLQGIPTNMIFQSTLPMRGVTGLGDPVFIKQSISIHTPHAGSDSDDQIPLSGQGEFQSTLPMRGVTVFSNGTAWPDRDFNPHSPCGE